MGIEFCIWWWQLYRQKMEQKRRQPAETQAQQSLSIPRKPNAAENAQPMR